MTPSDIPSFLTPFPYSCSGFEQSVEKCDVIQNICSMDGESDIVAIECHVEPTAPVSIYPFVLPP